MPTYTAGKPTIVEFFVPAGDYKLRVIEATDDTSKAGNEMVKLKLRIKLKDGTDGPALFDYLVFNDKCFWKVDAFLKSCGEHPGEGVSVDVDPKTIIGWECEANLSLEEFEGKKSNKVNAYLWDDDFK